MGIVKTTRKVGRFAGRALDAEDREMLSRAIVLVAGAGAVVLSAAGILGLALRFFALAAG